MKVIVTVEAKFVVDVDAQTPAAAERAVEANWDAIYRHTAKWYDGTAPQCQRGRVVSVTAQR